jgi:hypothetical protein
MKNLFSLDWFKSERQVELEQLKNKEQKLKNKLLEQQLDSKKEELGYVLTFNNGKPYNNVRLINNILSVTLRDNTLLTKTNATEKDYYDIKAASLEEEVISIMICPEQKEERDAFEKEYKRKETLRNGIEFLARFSMFTVKNDSLYLKGVDRSIPQLLAERFLEITDGLYFEEEVERSIEFCSLRKFWLKCCLNPNAQSSEDLYVFLAHHQFKIDSHGNFYAYRRVVSKDSTDDELIDFISNTYNKVKAIWKKNPNNYSIHKDVTGSYFMMSTDQDKYDSTKDISYVGNLKDLYLDLPNMSSNSYTSAHTGLEDYKVGSVISMPRHQGDDNNQMSCSKGFHAASKKYDYSGFGDTPILVIINPMDVLSVPVGEVGKLRTCRWFFAMTLTEDEEHILDDQDFDVTDLGDVFEEACGQDLESYVHNSFTEEVQRHTFTIPQMSNIQINKIVKTLNEMKDEIEKRVQSII